MPKARKSEKKYSKVKTHFAFPDQVYLETPQTLEIVAVLGKRKTMNGNIVELKLEDGTVRKYLESFIIKE